MEDIVSHYSAVTESDRLSSGIGLLERERTLEILGRFLPEPPATILDVGGAAGVYAFPLAERGYQVQLIDLTPLHVEQCGHEPRVLDGLCLMRRWATPGSSSVAPGRPMVICSWARSII